ncbi:PD40 domain-containing protein [candidate division KSB1 bacterium]|nr:PD40 domain-containing protein [candidate division KSB1 bacterium]
MKHMFNVFLAGIAILFLQCASHDSAGTKLDYFNQHLPGLTPEPFAADILTHPDYRIHGFPTWSPDGNEVYWSVVPPNIMFVKRINNKWSKPAIAAFSEGNIQASVFLPQSDKLFFQLSHPDGYGNVDIWYVQKNDTAWSHKRNMGHPPNSVNMESQPTFTKNGTIYFTGYCQDVAWNRGIFRSRCNDNTYDLPELLPTPINTTAIDYTSFIAPDESFLLFASTRLGVDENDMRIYISFRQGDNSWSEPRNLNNIMAFDRPSRFPCLTPDGEFIVFQSEGAYYWVSSKIIGACR